MKKVIFLLSCLLLIAVGIIFKLGDKNCTLENELAESRADNNMFIVSLGKMNHQLDSVIACSNGTYSVWKTKQDAPNRWISDFSIIWNGFDEEPTTPINY